MTVPPPCPPLFPYTTLFRSRPASWAAYGRPAASVAPRAEVPSLATGDSVRHDALAERSVRSEEHTSELQSHSDLVCRLLLEKKKDTESLAQEQLVETVERMG